MPPRMPPRPHAPPCPPHAPQIRERAEPQGLAAAGPGQGPRHSGPDHRRAHNLGSSRAHFTALHPPANWHPETPDNARSLVLDVDHEGHHLLLTGDLDQLGLSELVSGPQPAPSIELMFSPHQRGTTP